MTSNNESEFYKGAETGARVAFGFACFLLIGVSMFTHSMLSSTIKYVKSGHFPNPPTVTNIIVVSIFLSVCLSLFFWSRRASRAAGKDRPVFSKRFRLIFSIFFVFLGIFYYI